MSVQRACLLALLSISAFLAGCPDSRTPKLPTTPKVPEPRVAVAPVWLSSIEPALPASGNPS